MVESLVESFVARKRYLPADATRVLEPGDLPLPMERIAARIHPDRQTWLAWANASRTWFVVAEKEAHSACDACWGPAVRIFFYNQDGFPVATGAWVFHANGKCTLCSL